MSDMKTVLSLIHPLLAQIPYYRMVNYQKVIDEFLITGEHVSTTGFTANAVARYCLSNKIPFTIEWIPATPESFAIDYFTIRKGTVK